MTVKAALVDVSGRRVKVRAAVPHTLPRARLATLPDVHLILGNVGIEGDDGKLCEGRELVQLCEERLEHPVIHGT